MNTIWKTVEGFENYEVSNTGQVRIKATGKAVSRDPFGNVLLDGSKRRSVARLVWAAFKNEPLPAKVGTVDGDRTNLHVDNLLRFSGPGHNVDVAVGEPCVDQPGEVWKVIPSFPDYQVSNQGRVRSQLLQFSGRKSEEWRIKAPGTAPFGYQFVLLRKDGKTYNRKIHGLVLEAFVGPRPTINGERACTRHLNGNPADNRVENLAWGTMKENMADKKAHGTANYLRGEDSWNAIFTEEQVAGFKERMAAGEWYRDIANEIDRPLAVIYNIGVGKSWKHVRPDLDCTPGLARKPRVPAAAVEAVKNGEKPVKVAERFGVSPGGITRAFKRATGMNPRQWAKAQRQEVAA